MKDVYNVYDYHAGWMDMLVTERLSSSRLIVDQYANCGLSQVLELGTRGTLMDHIIYARMNGKDYMDSTTRLKVAHQVAAGLSALHTIDGSQVPAVAHNDLCARQYLLMKDGVYKLFDFDSSSFTKFKQNGTVCMERPEHMDDEVRSNDECLLLLRANAFSHSSPFSHSTTVGQD